jgi:hypothetical protein
MWLEVLVGGYIQQGDTARCGDRSGVYTGWGRVAMKGRVVDTTGKGKRKGNQTGVKAITNRRVGMV